MILVGNQRGGGRDLAMHLLKEENEHIEVHQIRGFASDTLPEAFNEAYAMSRGTRCKQYLFSLSLNPPPGQEARTEHFESAIDRAEGELGLTGQPRAVVFHEKEGRRHAHAVWSRIDAEQMKAVQLSHSRNKLMEVSRELYREHGWRMPDGMADRSKRDPRNFSLAEWQQAKRQGKDPRAIKEAIQDAWAISDSQAAFSHALEERGYKLARGDRRGFVALDHTGEPYAIAKWAAVKTKAVRERLGDGETLPGVADARAQIARNMLPAMERLKREAEAQRQKCEGEFKRQRIELVTRQRDQRAALSARHDARQLEEAKERQARFQPGLRGLWHHLTGEHKRTKERNEREAYEALIRDRAEKDKLILAHLDQRAQLNQQCAQKHQQQTEARRELQQNTNTYVSMAADAKEERRRAFREKRQQQAQSHQRNRDGPDLSR